MNSKFYVLPFLFLAGNAFAATQTILDEGFESGTGSWAARGSETVSSASNVYHSGSKSLKVSNRSSYWNGASLSTDNVSSGNTYDVEAYVYFDGSSYSTSSSTSTTTTSSDIISLKEAYADYFKIGTCLSASEASKSQAKSLVATHFNSVTPENELKPDAMLNQSLSQSKGNNVNPQVQLTSGAKTLLQYCSDNKIPFRGHCLVWHSQTPSWFFKENFSSTGANVSVSVMNQRMENYIKNVIELVTTSYPNLQIYAWDVVNEVFQDGGGSLRTAGDNNTTTGTSVWTAIYGNTDFIYNAFTYAKKYAPAGCKLYYNDFNEYIEAKRNAIYNLVSDMYKKGICDGIGMQSHLDTSYPSTSLYEAAFQKFSQIGCDIQVTELDVTCTDASTQATYYKNIFDIYKKYKDYISAVVLWGTQDGMSWRSSKNPLIFNSSYQPKQAYYKIVEGMSASSSSTSSATSTDTNTGLSSCNFELCYQYNDGSDTKYVTFDDASVPSKTWTKLAGSITIPSGASEIKLYVQTKDTDSDSDLIDFYMDDVKCATEASESSQGSGQNQGQSQSGGQNGSGSTVVTEAGVVPLVYNVENTGAGCDDPVSLNKNNLKTCKALPNPFEWADGSGQVTDFCDWACRRNEIKREIEYWEIGEKPTFDKLEASYSGGTLTVKITNGSNTLTLTSKLSIPSGNGPHPIVIGMDGNTGSINSSYFSKCIQVPFTHSQIAEYNSGFGGSRSQSDPFYKLYPNTFNTKADYCAWSWGISRLIDGLYIVKDQINADLDHIAVSGCSYAGKMALFAGAFDERIALTISQESGGGGINSWRVSEEIGTSVEGISNTNYDWFLNSFKTNFNGQTSKIPYDHHELIAMIAPRAFLGFGNTDYEWLGNPSGYVSLKGAEEVWKAMGIEDRFGYVIDGNHSHCAASSVQNSAVEKFVAKFLYGDNSQNTIIRTSNVNKDYTSYISAWANHTIVNNGCGEDDTDYMPVFSDENAYTLDQNAPNPVVADETAISFSIANDGFVSIVLYNSLGMKVMNIVDDNYASGSYTQTIHVGNLPAGIYHYVMNVNGFSLNRTMIIK